MLFLPKIIRGYSGTIVNYLGYSNFLSLKPFKGFSVILLILVLNKSLINKK
jgi:hypothetical protein